LIFFVYILLATPPNAMILLHSNVKPTDLIKAGIGLKLFGIIVIFIFSTTLLTSIFDLNDMQSFFNATEILNTTMSSS